MGTKKRSDLDGTEFISAVVLAAGSSTRMGRPKQLLWFGDRPLLQVVLDAAIESCVREVVVVLGDHAEEIERALQLPAGDRCRVVRNPDYRLGQSTSLRLGLQSVDARAEAAAVLLGDQPGVSATLVDCVVRAFVDARATIARPVYRSAAGKILPGHPVLLARRVWGEIDGLRGDRGARSIIQAHPDWLVEVPVEGEPPRDIDTADDYRTIVDTLPAVTVRR